LQNLIVIGIWIVRGSEQIVARDECLKVAQRGLHGLKVECELNIFKLVVVIELLLSI